MEISFLRIIATIINFALLIGIIILIFKFLKSIFVANKKINKIEKDIEEIKNELNKKS